jgi:hypothetical protein
MRVVVMSPEEYRERRGDQSIVPMVIYPNGAFLWVCPGCRRGCMGQLGGQPVSGWDNPRWTREGDDEHLTLVPSLGCAGWKNGDCPEGHYWLRNGELEVVP